MASIAKRENGWQVQIRKRGFKPISKRFKTKIEATEWAKKTEKQIENGLYIEREIYKKITLRDLLKRYVENISISKKSFKSDRSRINFFLKLPISYRFIDTLRSVDFSSFRDERLKIVSPTTVNKELNLFSHVFETARRDWSIQVPNPIKDIRRPKNARPRNRRINSAELEILLKPNKSDFIGKIILFAIETAMRRGEISSALWENVNFNDRTLHLPITKNGEARDVPLSNKAMEVLFSMPPQSKGSIFSLSPDSITQAFNRICSRNNIIDLRFHDLRHEATSRFFEKGLNTMQVSAITGHKTLEMLKRYTHLKGKDLVKFLD